jgi:two-component SAPR family response regulator
MSNNGAILIVETEFIIALGIQSTLHALGLSQVVLATSPDEAATLLQDWSTLALAIVEIEVDKPGLIEFALQLVRHGVTIIGLSADSRLVAGLPDLPGIPILIKPLPDADLAQTIQARLDQKP